MTELSIRKKLGKVVIPENAEKWSQADLFEKYIRRSLPKELEVIYLPPVKEKNYNCFVYVLNLQNDDNFVGEKSWKFIRLLGSIFEEMIQKNILEKAQNCAPDSIVVYKDHQGNINHVGRFLGEDKVISKWSLGPTIKHALMHVPDHYGDVVEFYKITDEVVSYVKEKQKRISS